MYALLLSDLEKEKTIYEDNDYMTKHLTTRSKQEILSMNVTKLKYFCLCVHNHFFMSKIASDTRIYNIDM